MIDDILCAVATVTDEVYELTQLLINDDTAVSMGSLNDGTHSDIRIFIFL